MRLTYKWNKKTTTLPFKTFKTPELVVRPIDPTYKPNPEYLNDLRQILKYKRPAGSEGEEMFIAEIIDTIPGVQKDGFGNRILEIPMPDGTQSTTSFSCHTDTVHQTTGKQKLICDTKNRMLSKNDGECLGADDGAGCFILFKLIEHKVPGLYLFHREEEIGGNGSTYLAEHHPEMFDNIDRMLAFDRKGTKDIITEQGYECASDQFAYHLADKLKMEHCPDPTGSFTDSANYTHLVGECTNVSIGYTGAHTASEDLDYEYLFKLTDALLTVNFEGLVTIREPAEAVDPWVEYDYGYGYGYETLPSRRNPSPFSTTINYDEAFDLIWKEPNLAAYILSDLNVTEEELIEYREEFNHNREPWDYEDLDNLTVGMA